MSSLNRMQVLPRRFCAPAVACASGPARYLARLMPLVLKMSRPLSFKTAWLTAIILMAMQPIIGIAGDTSELDKELLQTAKSGDLAAVVTLLGKGANVNARDARASTPIIEAARNGHFAIVQLLIEKGADVNARHEGRCTALWCAAWAGNLEMVKLLLDKGADLNVMTVDCSTILMAAAASLNPELIKLLLDKGAEPRAIDCSGNTAYNWALGEGGPKNREVAKLFPRVMKAEDAKVGNRVPRSLERADLQTACVEQLWETKMVTGVVTSYSPHQLSIRLTDGTTGEPITIRLTEKTRVSSSKQLSTGQRVEVRYSDENGGKLARIITVAGTDETAQSTTRHGTEQPSYPDTPRGVIDAFLKETLVEPLVSIDHPAFCLELIDYPNTYFLQKEDFNPATADPDDPRWRWPGFNYIRLHIASDFKVSGADVSNDNAKVKVLFRRVGWLEEEAGRPVLHITNDDRIVAYSLFKPALAWRIVGEDGGPYIPITTAIKWLRCHLKNKSDASEASSKRQSVEIEEAIRTLKKRSNR